MQSDQGNQSQNSVPLTQRVLPGSVQQGLKDGDSILDFVKRNSPGYESASTVIQRDVDRMAEEKNREAVTAPEPAAEPVQEPEPDIISDESEPEPNESPVADEDSDSDDIELRGDAAENFKKLRTKLKEVKEESSNKDKILSDLTKELESYAKGEKMPEELQRREARITELEHYEKLLNLKKSKYYQENFVKPIEALGAKLNNIAKDYNVDPERLRQAANLKSEADINRFLSNNFDAVGAGEVKGLIREYRAIQSKAVEAEKEPEKSLNAMIENSKAIRAKQQVERLQVMQDITRNAWKESLDSIKEEGKVRELIYKEGDIEHNSKVFTPIVQAAATEYGKLVKELVKNGLEDLPKPLAYALSRMCQLAHASAVSIDSRERAVALAEKIQTNTQRTQRYIRPSVSGKMDSGKTSPEAPGNPMEAAERLLQQVRGNK